MSQARKEVPLPPQYMFVSNRDIVVTSTRGYSLEFVKGVPMHAPKPMHAELIEKGILPVADGGGIDVEAMTEAQGTPKKVLLAPETQEERDVAIEQAIRAVVERNNPSDFTAGGVPSPTTLTAALGWRVDMKEIRGIWTRLKPELLKKG
ncbi:MAG TPA: hypothetical protein VD931_22805 [Baekduia sp.]|nr:hypothetical protein [Baekduia sp.]